jgi:hypothetical protein
VEDGTILGVESYGFQVPDQCAVASMTGRCCPV